MKVTKDCSVFVYGLSEVQADTLLTLLEQMIATPGVSAQLSFIEKREY